MAEATRLQAQVRALTRDVGTLKEQLRQETKKRERLAVHAKEQEAAADAAQSRAKQLQYVNTKLEQELRTVREKADSSSAKTRSSLNELQGKLAAVEKEVHSRSLEAQRQVHRVHGLVQGLQAVAMPLAVASAAAGSTATGAAATGRRGPALRTPGQPAQLPASSAPERLHRGFASIFAGLAQLAAIFSGGEQPEAVPAGANPAPLLLTAPDGSTKAVRWHDENAGTAAASPCSSTNCHRPESCNAEKQQLQAQVQRLRGELAAAHEQAAAAATAAAAAASAHVSSSSCSSQVQAAIRQVEAVVPQYKAAAQSLQGQVGVLKEKLAAAGRERAALQQEVTRWREAAAKHEAAFAQAAARLHANEARSLAANTEVNSRSERLAGDVESLRQRCGELASRLREARQQLAQQGEALAVKDKLAATQQATIQQLEATIAEQQADIRSALDLVSGSRTAGHGGHDPLLEPEVDFGSTGAYQAASWGTALGAQPRQQAASWDLGGADHSGAAAAVDSAGLGLDPSEYHLSSLLNAATAAAGGAEAWADGAFDVPGTGSSWGWDAAADSKAAASPFLAWQGEAGGWSIPAVPGPGSSDWGAVSSPAAAAAGAGGPGSKPRPLARVQQSDAQQQAAGQSNLTADIAGLEAALRSALDDL